ncbi:uncharacterized protein EMH_0091100 [Eimeria mitis]|uniref:PIK-related kinase FAT domain-containing protein n=1 Tax=Eimeria mitis TaxID=44415 RepID=U6KIG2_9EIME|nr:uncharacterized protein EMH_0091100 [Eimeria mitis]CDJ36581.1 hypothetical protein, conserved [Eimeria mitis]
MRLETEERREEVTWWERLWIDCCRELNRWNSLHEVSQAAARRSQLSLQCAAKLQHWGEIDRLLQLHQITEPATKLCQTYQSLHEVLYPKGQLETDARPWVRTEKLQEIDMHCAEVQRLLLQSWRNLPLIVNPKPFSL